MVTSNQLLVTTIVILVLGIVIVFMLSGIKHILYLILEILSLVVYDDEENDSNT